MGIPVPPEKNQVKTDFALCILTLAELHVFVLKRLIKNLSDLPNHMIV